MKLIDIALRPRSAPLRAGALTLGLALLAAPAAYARPGIFGDWQARYGAASPSGDNATCQLCHAFPGGGSPWNAYGWDVRDARMDPACDLDESGDITNAEAFFCVESENSDALGTDGLAPVVVELVAS